jgi:16S rRNA (cytosine1402-N4)-methyltransferase
MEATAHRPVLLREALAALAVRPGGFWVDGTVGAGGHAEAILRATSPDGRLLACDRDAESLRTARARLAPFGERVVLRHADYRRLPGLLDEVGVPAVAGILLDLGISSLQLDDPERGFSFQKDGPLDMRIDRTQQATAADLVNSLAEERLAAILKQFGEEKAAGRIARAVARERAKAAITSTRRLAEIVAVANPPGDADLPGAAHRDQPRDRGAGFPHRNGGRATAAGRADRGDRVPLPRGPDRKEEPPRPDPPLRLSA